jgi:hypothetical protein
LEYDHGGLSPQECVIPTITISTSNVSQSTVSIQELNWIGFRLKGIVEGAAQTLTADIRTKANDPDSSVIGGAKEIKEGGSLSLIVKEDRWEGTAAFLVILNPSGEVISKDSVTIGG